MQNTRRMLAVTTWIIILSFVALTVATYAWMSIATFYKISDVELNVITENALEIAKDENGQAGEWGKFIAGDDIVADDAILRPVTWSAEDAAFYSPTYGVDGRIIGYAKHLITTNDIPAPFVDEAEEEKGEGYLIAIDLWMRTGASKITTYLSGPDTVQGQMKGDGTFVIGIPTWNETDIRHESGGKGAENAIRIAFKTYDYYDITGALYEKGSFYIYEPNTQEDEITNGINGMPLHGDGELIRQYPSGILENAPVLRDTYTYMQGEFIEKDTHMFDLLANIPRKVTVYIWLEGQDSACRNAISEGRLLINLQIGATTKYDQGGITRPEGDKQE